MSVNNYTMPTYPNNTATNAENVTPIVLIAASVVSIAAVTINDKFIKHRG